MPKFLLVQVVFQFPDHQIKGGTCSANSHSRSTFAGPDQCYAAIYKYFFGNDRRSSDHLASLTNSIEFSGRSEVLTRVIVGTIDR
jgi:hypothetical protein